MLYNRGLINSMLGVEAIRTAQEKYGKKPMTGEQVRWGFENLDLTADRIKELGFEGMLRPIKFTCQDHQGADWPACSSGTARSGRSSPTTTRPTLRILEPHGQGDGRQVRGGEEHHAARLLQGELERRVIR